MDELLLGTLMCAIFGRIPQKRAHGRNLVTHRPILSIFSAFARADQRCDGTGGALMQLLCC
ncbi:hypothetical protein ILP92_16480 [Maribius pontilimi]|uniref:Uncharacterized protein n=1 Tax=Palleronia pontilimi TaxID=1964209 RepID=A0A934ILQ2_9RHOB|nr:hypothetical protein [Palleronia pontilimi]MBJ3764339.1 hypothetical protein [Palleronia pontilimi]